VILTAKILNEARRRILNRGNQSKVAAAIGTKICSKKSTENRELSSEIRASQFQQAV
jgi:hypothetical protein